MRNFYLPARFAYLTLAILAPSLTAPFLLAQERPWSVSPCELLKNPGMYADTLVNVPGYILYGQGQFTAHGYDCADEYGALKLEFGGNPTDPKDQFRLPQSRLEAGTVPLKKDTDYETMQRLMKQADAAGRTKMLRATLNGRFFAGPAVGNKSGEVKHPNARLVISEVELVSDKLEAPADFTPLGKALPKPSKGCAVTELAVPSREEEDKLQRLSREPSEDLAYLADPAQVAARAVAAQEQRTLEELATNLKPTGETVAMRTYAWTTPDGLRTYAVTVTRPYWLLPSTWSGDTVIWVPQRILKTTCGPKPAR